MVGLSTVARAATIVVNSVADPGAPGICGLRDAITAANTKTAANGCAAGTGNDTINFSVVGTLTLTSTLPQMTDTHLTINGPASPGITISGGDKVPVMAVAIGATVGLSNLTIANGLGLLNSESQNLGGAIENDGTLTVTNSTFSRNFAGGPTGESVTGGGAIGNFGTLTVTNSTFSNNSTDLFGGGIYNVGTLTVTNSTFSGNFAVSGGGIYNLRPTCQECGPFSGELTVTNSTFFGNGADDGGAAVYNFSGSSSFKSTILAGSINDTVPMEPPMNCFGTITDLGYNISDDNTCGFRKTGSANNGDNVNPLLSPAGLSNNDGPTQTIALLPRSPAIDAIPVEACTDQASPPKPVTTDQRGFPRPDAGEEFCDIGAYEFQQPFARQPGEANCHGQRVSALAQKYGGIAAAASALGFGSVKALQDAIKAFCGT
jgi:hypothetical protein